MFENLDDDDIMSEEQADNIMNNNKAQDVEYVDPDTEYYEESVEPEEEYQDDLEADLEVLKNASLRLEQGNLYKMLLKHDLFDGVDADKRAISNVQRELRAFIRERLEVMLGIKQDPRLSIKSSAAGQFTELEVQLLKEVVAKAINRPNQPSPIPAPTQVKPNTIKPVQKTQPSIVKVNPTKQSSRQPQQKQKQAEEKKDGWLDKHPKDMTQQELVEYNRHVSQKQLGKKSAQPAKKLPMPDSQQIETMYMTRAANNTTGGLIGAILSKTGKNLQTIENVGGDDGDYSNDGRI